MKSTITAVVCGCLAIVFASAGAADPRPDDKLPVLKPKEIRHINPNWSGASGVAFSPDGKRVVATADGGYGPNGIFAVWDIETGKKLLESSVGEGKKWAGRLCCVAYSPNGKLIATGGRRAWTTKPEDQLKPALDIWDAQTGKRIRTLEARAPGAVYAVAFSPDGKRIVSGGGNVANSAGTRLPHEQDLNVWDVETGKELLDLKGHKWPVASAKFSGNGKRIVSSDSASGPAPPFRLWDAETGKELLTIKDLGDELYRCVAINRDGTRIVTGGLGNGRVVAVRLWDADTGKELRTVSKVPLSAVAFHPNDKWIVGVTAGGLDVMAGTVMIWDIATGREVVSFRQTGIPRRAWTSAPTASGSLSVSTTGR